MIRHSGNFKNTERFFKKVKDSKLDRVLQKYGNEGVSALALATPKDTGLTAASWKFVIRRTFNGFVVDFFNVNMVNNVIIAVILQYGHGLKNGRYLSGIDYINPALRPIFNKMADTIWKEVVNS